MMKTIKWTNIHDITPELDKPVLILYYKGKNQVITQGYFTDTAINASKREQKSVNIWRAHGYGLTWFDYADRQIQNLQAKKSKNDVTHWAELPNLPK